MKKTVRILITLGCILVFSVPGIAVAKEKQTLTKFTIPAYQGIGYTSQLTKTYTNDPWVIKIDDIGSTVITQLDTGLLNSNGELRSQYARVRVIGRHVIPSTGTAGYWYKAFLMNSNSSWLKTTVSGSWSPDDRE